MGGLSWWHWLIIISAFVLLFGAEKLPDAARGLGRSLRILKSEVSAMQEEEPSSSAFATGSHRRPQQRRRANDGQRPHHALTDDTGFRAIVSPEVVLSGSEQTHLVPTKERMTMAKIPSDSFRMSRRGFLRATGVVAGAAALAPLLAACGDSGGTGSGGSR